MRDYDFMSDHTQGDFSCSGLWITDPTHHIDHRQVAERIGKGQYVRYRCIEAGMVLLVQDALDQGNAIQRDSKFY